MLQLGQSHLDEKRLSPPKETSGGVGSERIRCLSPYWLSLFRSSKTMLWRFV